MLFPIVRGCLTKETANPAKLREPVFGFPWCMLAFDFILDFSVPDTPSLGTLRELSLLAWASIPSCFQVSLLFLPIWGIQQGTLRLKKSTMVPCGSKSPWDLLWVSGPLESIAPKITLLEEALVLRLLFSVSDSGSYKTTGFVGLLSVSVSQRSHFLWLYLSKCPCV